MNDQSEFRYQKFMGFRSGTNYKINTDPLIPRGGISNNLLSTGNSGDLTVYSKNLVIENGADINTSNSGSGNSGNLIIHSDRILLSKNGHNVSTGIINTNSQDGTLGMLSIEAKSLRVTTGAQISASALSKGNAGDININSQSIVLSGENSEIYSKSLFNAGNSGEITIKTDLLKMTDGAAISTETFGFGLGGNLTVEANTLFLSGADTEISTDSGIASSRNAGNLTITSNQLDLQDQAIISTSTLSQGVSAFINVIEGNPLNFSSTDLSTLPLEKYQNIFGNGGALTINVRHLNIQDNAVISASTFGNGDAGNLTINAQSIVIKGNQSDNFTGIASQANGTIDDTVGYKGNAGNLTIITTDTIALHDDARISSSTFGIGNAGNVTIRAKEILLNNSTIASTSKLDSVDISNDPEIAKSGSIFIVAENTLVLDNESSISVETQKSNAGEIIIASGNQLSLSNSGIATSVANGKGNGGNIIVNSPVVSLDSSQIVAQAKQGSGGNISISGFVFQSPSSVIDASSEQNTDGELNLQPETNISGNLAVLPALLLNASEHLSDRCISRSGKNKNSFVIKSRGGVPLSPGGLIPSTFIDISNSPDKHFTHNKSDAQYAIPKETASWVSSGNDTFLPFTQQVDCHL